MAVSVLGWSSAALYWLVRRPWQSARSLASRAGGRHGRDVASRSDPSPSPQHRHVGRFVRFSSRALVLFAFPGGTSCQSPRMGAARRDGALLLEFDFPGLLFSPVVERRRSARRLRRCVSRERLHDRRPADDRRRFCQRGLHGVPTCARLCRILRLPVLPASDGDSAAEARTLACLPPGSVAPSFRSWSTTQPRRAASRSWMRARSRTWGWLTQRRLRSAAIRICAFDRGEHVLRCDSVEEDRHPPGREPERR